ncbi:DUF4255 domain-containing protein [Wukongibacter baidiensis]|uniref:DUF4255 domain-containing protein n=1 Tax=Wukongibacter baidiensis TaxID=1723361 RepID=UPI003D7FCB1B
MRLLQENLIPEPIDKKENIGLCSPAEKGDFQLTLYLYNIEESGEFRQTEMIKLPDGNLRYPPISFNLYYLLTAYSTAELKYKALDEHKILGRAIQVLYDNAILRDSQLVGSLKDSNQEIRLEIKNLSYDEMMRIWNFNDIPYSLSIAYRVGPVLIDSTRIKEVKRVVDSKISVVRKDRSRI